MADSTQTSTSDAALTAQQPPGNVNANGALTIPSNDAAISQSIDAYTQQELQKQNSVLQANLAKASEQDPNLTAEAQQLGLQVGVGPDIAARNMAVVRKMSLVQDAGAANLPQTAPRLAKLLEDPNFAGVAYDDLGNLSRIEQGAATIRALTPMESFRYNFQDPANKALMQFPLTRVLSETVGASAKMAGDVGSFFGWHGTWPTRQNWLQQQAQADMPETYGLQHTGLDTLAENVGPMIPALLASGGISAIADATKLSEGAAKILAAIGVGGLFSASQGGETYTQMSASGKSDAASRRAAMEAAGITALPNMAMGMTDFVPALERNPLLASLGFGGATGAAGQMAQNVATGQGPWYRDLGKGAVQGAAVMGGMHLGFGAFQSGMGQITDAVEASKLRKRSPEASQAHLDATFEGDPSVRIPAEDFVNYFQRENIDPAVAANQVGVSNLEEAAAAGSDLEIPKENFFGKLAPEHQRGLLPDIVDPVSGMTPRQSDAAKQELQEWIDNGGAAKLQAEYEQADAETQATPEWKSVYSDLKQRYLDAGEKENAANGYATLQANAIANLATQVGMKPDELLALHNPKIVAAESPETMLYQSAAPIDGQDGKETTVLTPARELPAKYRLVEADSLIPSHNANTFARNPAYPEGLQERAYDTSKEAQARVIQQAQNYDPRYTVNTNPDAINGPPIVTPDGIVLGGNSRAMSTQRLYAEDGSAYKDALKEQAAAYGFTPEQVEDMDKPVLVRQVDAPATADDARRLGSELNKSMTGAMGVSERAVSAGKNIKPDTLRSVADMMQADDSTLREAMAKRGSEIVKMLTGDGVITERERPQFVDTATGGLSEEGKTFVERALMGSVIDDPRLMDSAPKAVLNKLERSLGSIASFASRPDEWNLLPAIREAVAELGTIQRRGTTVDLHLGQTSMFGEERNPLVDAMVRALDGKPNEVRTAFDRFARDSDENKPGQSRMFSEANAFDAFNHAFGSKLSEQEYHDGLEKAATKAPDLPAGADAQGDEGVPRSATGDATPRSQRSPEQESVALPTRGWFRMKPDGGYEIGKTKIGDMSTLVHEPAHAYLELFRELSSREGASASLRDDFKKITSWLGTTPEEARANGFTREQHEKWARANEQYVREGRAPSAELRSVFHRFAVWLGSIYQRANDLKVEMSPEIRGVMDRLYAREGAVDRAERQTGEPLFKTPEEAGWTEDEFRAYAEAQGIAVDKAREQVASELNAAAERDRTEEFREEKANVRDAVTEQMDARPEYTAIRGLRRGKLDDGTEMTLSREALVDQFGEERVKALQKLHRGLYRQEGGVDADTAAELFGFHSGEEMLRALENAPRRTQAIEAATRDYLVNKYGDVRYDGTLNDRARFAIENDERAGNLYRQLRALKTRVASLEKKAADTKTAMAGIALPPLEHYEAAAHDMIQKKAIADIQPYRYLNASRKFSRDAFEAAGKGDARRAFEAKNKELLNHFLFREAAKESEWVDKFEKYARKSVTSKGIQQRLGLADENARQTGDVGDYRAQHNWLLARYRLWGGRPEDAAKPARSLDAWAGAMYDSDREPAIAPSMLNESRAVDYRSAPLSELHDLHDALVNIRHLAKKEYEALVDGKRIQIEQMAKELDESIRANMKVSPEKVFDRKAGFFRGLARSIDAQNSRMEFLVDRWDGGVRGFWRKYLWEPYENAKGDELGLQADFTKAVNDAVEKEAERQGLRLLDKVMIDGIPASEDGLTRKHLISMALNMGNASNLDRLQKTFDFHGWDRDAIRRVGGMLKPEEWDFVQGIWDSLKPWGERMKAFEERQTGLPPVMVQVKPFHVVLDDGTEVDLPGGYYPVKYDPRYVAKGYEEDATKSARSMMEKGYGRVTTSRNYTMKRTGSAGPLLLDYERVLTEHVAKATKDLTFREVAQLGNRLLLHPRVQRALRETQGPGADEDAMAWLRAAANDRNGSIDGGPNDMRPYLMKLRSNLVKASLAFKGSTSLLQFTHLPRLMEFTTPKSYTQAMVDFWKNPVEMTRIVREQSPNEMRFRGENLSRDYRATLQEVAKQKGLSARALRFGYAAFRYVDHAVSFPLWLSVYNDTLVKNGPEMDPSEAHNAAMHAADSAVRMGMGTGTTGDLPPIMRSPDLFKQFETTLFGFENLNYNILRHKVGGNAAREFRAGRLGSGAAGLSYGLAMTFFIPAIVSSLVRGDGPKDGENIGEWAAKRSLFFGMGTIPLVKDAASLMEYGSDKSLNPVAGFGGRVVEDLRRSAREESTDWTAFGIDALEAIGDAFGVEGTSEAAHVARYEHRAQQGKIENPNMYGALVGGH